MMETTTRNVRVRRVCAEAVDVRSFELVGVDGRPLQPFEAGAHIDVHLGDGLIRQYSLINTTGTDGSYRIAVKLEPNSRGGSQRMHAIAEGDVLTIGLPRNNFALDPAAGHSILLAGGIGVTPLLGMASRLIAKEASFSFDYFARSQDAMAFADEIGRMALGSRSRLHLGLDGEAVGVELANVLKTPPPGSQIEIGIAERNGYFLERLIDRLAIRRSRELERLLHDACRLRATCASTECECSGTQSQSKPRSSSARASSVGDIE
jgi:vanillate monooxygenase ferredoxin subunit